MKNKKRMGKKGELTINGILGILVTLMFLAFTMPMQITWIGTLYSSLENDSTAQLITLAIIPMEMLMVLMSIVYAARSARAAFSEYSPGY